MNLTISNPGPNLTSDDIDAFEKRHNVVLPNDYRTFLQQFNGGMPSKEVLDRPNGPSIVVWLFYSLNDGTNFDLDKACYSLDWEEAHEQGYLCIGRDPGGSGIFISTKGDDRGAILFFDREETLRPASGAVRIADSFDSMMSNLRPL